MLLKPSISLLCLNSLVVGLSSIIFDKYFLTLFPNRTEKNPVKHNAACLNPLIKYTKKIYHCDYTVTRSKIFFN